MACAEDQCQTRGHEKFASIRSAMRRDVERLIKHTGGQGAAGLSKKLGALLTPPIFSLLLYRTAHWLHVNRWTRCAWAMTWLNFYICKVTITPQSCIGDGCLVPHPAGVYFHGRAGDDVTLFALCACLPDAPGLAAAVAAGPLLGNRVSVGGHVCVLGSIHLEDSVKVAPNVRVSGNVPENVLVISRNTFIASTSRINAQ